MYCNIIIGKYPKKNSLNVVYIHTESPLTRFYWFLFYNYSAMSIYVQESEFQTSSFVARIDINCCFCCMKSIDSYKVLHLLSCLLDFVCLVVRSAVLPEHHRCGDRTYYYSYCLLYFLHLVLLEYQHYCFNIDAVFSEIIIQLSFLVQIVLRGLCSFVIYWIVNIAAKLSFWLISS